MTKLSKVQANSVARQLTNKSASWGQVAKQLSGMKGKIALTKKTSVSVAQAFNMLGVSAKGNKYTAHDLGLAWSEKLKESKALYGTENTWRCPLLSKAIAIEIEVGGESFKLYTKDEENKGYVALKKQELCRVVKAEDKEKCSNDIVVSAKVVLQGLVQSIFADDTLAQYDESQKKAAEVAHGYINKGTATEPNFVEVEKSANVWHEKVTTDEKQSKKSDKKQSKKSDKKQSKKEVMVELQIA